MIRLPGGLVMADERHFTTRRIAEICGVNLNTVQNWARRKLIISFRTAGGHLRFREPDVVDFLNRQGIPLPEELDQRRPRVFCLCRDCVPAETLIRWLRRDFEARTFQDPWELMLAIGVDTPALVIIDRHDAGEQDGDMIDALRHNVKTAAVPVVFLRSQNAPKECLGDEELEASIDWDGLKPAALRKAAFDFLP